MKRNQPSDDKNQLKLDDFSICIEEVAQLPRARKGTADTLRIRYKDFGEWTIADYEIFTQLPEHPFWSQVERWIDFSFADDLCAPLYSSNGQRPYAPSLKLKVHLIQAFEDISDREMETRLVFDLAIKRFVGIPASYKGIDHSTIALDRSRMGSVLFDACFHYILAQAKAHGLWGHKGERWLIDSFHTHAHATRFGSFRLITQSMLQVIQHLKRGYRTLFELLEKTLQVSTWFNRLPFDASPEERAVEYSHLVVRAYSLLAFFENDTVKTLVLSWPDEKKRRHSDKLQHILYTILTQNTRPTTPSDSSSPPSGPSEPTSQPQDQEMTYTRIPHKERSKDRIRSAYDPEVRNGKKSNHVRFFGDKIQVVESDPSNFILEIEPIPGNEHDGEALPKLVKRVMEIQETKPDEVVGDTAYGSGRNRHTLENELKLQLTAPIAPVTNPSGLLLNEYFDYDKQEQRVTCPQGHTTTHRVRNNKLEGFQYKFSLELCRDCSIREGCTTSKTSGRTILISDYNELMEKGKAYNETEEGQVAFKSRKKIERTNNELANHHGLRNPRTRGRENLRITAKLKAMVVNLKLMVKKLGTIRTDPFVRNLRTKGSLTSP